MLAAAEQVDQMAQGIVQRVAETLSAPTWLLDQRGRLLASSRAGPTGLPFEQARRAPEPLVRVRLHVVGQEVELLVGEPDDGSRVTPRLAQAVGEMVITQTAVMDRLPSAHELKSKFIFDLLHGPMRDEEEVVREGQVLGMDLGRPRAVILVDAADYILSPAGPAAPERQALAQRAALRARHVINSIVSFFHLPDDTICAYIGGGEVVVLKASSTQDLRAWAHGESEPAMIGPAASWANLAALKRAANALLARLRDDTRADISIAIGRYHPGVQQLGRSYQDARAALSLGRRLNGHNRVHCLDTLGIAALVGVAEEQTRVELATHLLSPLELQGELLETLRVFFEENCCPSTTAQRLALHRNGLGYRLDKIASLIGLDPRRFDDAVQIRVALVLRSLHAAAGDLGSCPAMPLEQTSDPGQSPTDLGGLSRSA